jgi:hypothetical protein
MGKYDAIRGAGNVTVKAPPDFWTSFKQQYDDDYDRLIAAQDKKKAEDRYTKESTEEQNRYDTEQENLMFQQKKSSAENEYSQAMQEYQLAYEQIGKHNPEMLEKLQTRLGKKYTIPRQDGTFETRYVVAPSVKKFTKGKVQSKKDLDDILDRWSEFTPALKASLWPQVKKINRYFDRDLTDIEASAKRAMSYEDNAKLLDTMGAFLPAGYDATKWEAATKILLKDGEVSDADLKIIAADISQHITNRNDARKFWTNFSSDIMKARGALKLDSDPTTIKDLQGLSDIALGKLDEWYGISGAAGVGIIGEAEYNKKANEVSQRLYGKDVNELEQSQIPGVQEEVFTEISQPKQAGFISDKTIRGPFEQSPQDEESTVDFEKGTLEYPRRLLGQYIRSWFDQMKTVTPKELGYTSMESLLEGEFEKHKKDNPDFVSTYFNNDRDVWRKWFTGKRTMSSMLVPVPQKGKAVIQKGGVTYEPEGRKHYWSKEASRTTIDPLNGKMINGKILKRKINKNKIQFANLGIIVKEEWPFWDRVGKAKARQSLRK